SRAGRPRRRLYLLAPVLARAASLARHPAPLARPRSRGRRLVLRVSMDLRVAPVHRGLALLLAVALGIIAALAMSLAAPAPSTAQLLSPGRLSRAHRELEGDENCIRCHASGHQ